MNLQVWGVGCIPDRDWYICERADDGQNSTQAPKTAVAAAVQTTDRLWQSSGVSRWESGRCLLCN